jgi:pyruvate,orthophosphate dikinase
MTGNPRLAWDCYLRLILSYAETVQGLDLKPFEALSREAAAAAGVEDTAALDTLSLRGLVLRCLDLFADMADAPFPDDPHQQLRNAVNAVFASWNSPKAISYRRINRVDGLAGTAVTVQRMVYGNAGPNSGAGVGFTRDPATGEKRLYLDFAFDAQGEDVVSGRWPLTPATELARLLPDIMNALDHAGGKLERAFGDVQDFEFTVEEGELFLLQTRNAKRSAWARVKIAVDLAKEGLITPKEALRRLNGLDLSSVVRRRVASTREAIATGVAAGIGVASGPIAFTSSAARALAAQGKRPILVRNDIVTEDIDGIASAAGVLTARGGRTSHAAVVARELGKVAVVGCQALHLDEPGTACTIAGHHFAEGDVVTLDGENGCIYSGTVDFQEERPLEELALIEDWKKSVHDVATSG